MYLITYSNNNYFCLPINNQIMTRLNPNGYLDSNFHVESNWAKTFNYRLINETA